MIALVYVTIVVVLIYVLSSFLKFDSKDSTNSNANLGNECFSIYNRIIRI